MHVFILAAVLFFASPALGADLPLVLNTPGFPPYHMEDNTGYYDALMKEAFGRIGREVRVQYLPAERAITNANEGVEDGDVGRIPGLSAQYPNLIQVPEKVNDTSFHAFARDLPFTPAGWESLAPFNVGIIQGHKISEANVKGTKSLIKVENAENLFRMLDAKRLDIGVCEKYFGAWTVRKLGLAGIRPLDPPFYRMEAFLYLHVRHAGLVQPLTTALTAMKADGTYDRLVQTRLISP